jgi:hypothetical protein
VIFMVTRRAVTRIASLMAYFVLIGFMVVLYTSSVGLSSVYAAFQKLVFVVQAPCKSVKV